MEILSVYKIRVHLRGRETDEGGLTRGRCRGSVRCLAAAANANYPAGDGLAGRRTQR